MNRVVEITITAPVLKPLVDVAAAVAVLAAVIDWEDWQHGYEEWIALREALQRLDETEWLTRKAPE